MAWFGLSAPGPALAQSDAGLDRVPTGSSSFGLAGLGKNQPAEPVTLRAVPSRSVIYPGEQFAIAVVMVFSPHHHSWPTDVSMLPEGIREIAIPTRYSIVEVPTWLTSSGLQLPPTSLQPVPNPSGEGGPIDVLCYAGTAVAYIPITVAPDAIPAGADSQTTVTVRVSFQVCNDRVCLMPDERDLVVPVTLGTPGGSDSSANRTPNEPELFQDFDPAKAFSSAPGVGASGTGTGGSAIAPKPVEFNIFGWKFAVSDKGVLGKVTLILLAILGGLLLNFTPCVLPVIPIKILSLSAAAGNPARAFYLGVVMSVGIIGFWLAIGAAIAFISGFKTISTLFQTPWFSLGVGAFMLVMGAGMLGAYVIRLPQWVYMINPKNESALGSAGFGVMTAVLSTPCTAPFMGAASAWAAGKTPEITLATFAAIGLGMALPYLILAANPKWVDRMPRTGPASELIKQVMGILIFAVATFFLGLAVAQLTASPGRDPTRFYWWVVAVLVGGAGVWLAYSTIRITKSPARRVAFVAIGAATALAAPLAARSLTDRGPIDWAIYSPQIFAEARARGDVVVMDFTADWCLNCKAIEKAVLHRPAVAGALAEKSLVAMKVDLTVNNPDGKAMLRELEWVGIPLLAVWGPALDSPVKMDAYTERDVLDAIARARGGPASPANSPGAPPTPGGT